MVQRDKKLEPAKVLYKHHSPRSYVVETPEGNKYRRNRRQLHASRVPTEAIGKLSTILASSHTNQSLSMSNSQEPTSSDSVSSRDSNQHGISQSDSDETAIPPINVNAETIGLSTNNSQELKTTRSGRTVKTPKYLSDFEH